MPKKTKKNDFVCLKILCDDFRVFLHNESKFYKNTKLIDMILLQKPII